MLAGIQTLTLPSPLAPSPIVFFSVLGSAFARLNLFFSKPQKKTRPKLPPATQATEHGPLMNSYRPKLVWPFIKFVLGMSHSCAYFIPSV